MLARRDSTTHSLVDPLHVNVVGTLGRGDVQVGGGVGKRGTKTSIAVVLRNIPGMFCMCMDGNSIHRGPYYVWHMATFYPFPPY
ncbi:hypothetical protein EON63_17965 [archaeon]|nr:MAG: hypothetical protein EON63_17965 [archaeon]